MSDILRYIKAVLWGFVGLGRRGDMDELHRKANPVALVAVALLGAIVFVVALVMLARLAIYALS